MTKLSYANDDETAERYGELCNFFWYLTHPDYPKDDFLHTSDECRRMAREVFELLGIEVSG